MNDIVPKLPEREKYDLIDQLSRACKSIPRLIAEGYSANEAKEKIGMAIEGAYTCVSALELGRKNNIAVPITEATFAVLYENMSPLNAVKLLLHRAIKEEHL